MNREELTEKLNELMEDQQFAEKLGAAESVEDMVRVLGEYGVTVTPEELDGMLTAVPAGGELSEEDLENVSGGLIYPRWLILLAFKLGVAVGKLYLKYKNKLR